MSRSPNRLALGGLLFLALGFYAQSSGYPPVAHRLYLIAVGAIFANIVVWLIHRKPL